MGEVHDELKGFVTERLEGEDHVVDQQVTIRFPDLQKRVCSSPASQCNNDFSSRFIHSTRKYPIATSFLRNSRKKNYLSHSYFLYLVSSCDVVEDRVASLRCSSLNKIGH